MRIGSICSGIGGLDLAVERMFGANVEWFFENDKYASKVLAKHWPEVPNYGDVKEADWSTVEKVSVITAGYPCQPFSHAGLKLENDERIIWNYIYRGICEIRPIYVILENVPGHVTKGFAEVLGDLAESGYNSKWACLPASDIGAAHKRERLFVIATNFKSI